MPELNTYLLLSLVSAAVIFASGIHLLLKSIPRTEKMESYRISCRFLFGAYFILALANAMEILLNDRIADISVISSFTLLAGSFQAFLFTFALITLVHPGYITRRRLARQFFLITIAGTLLLVTLFNGSRRLFNVVLAACLLAYAGQLVYYTLLFRRLYGECIKKLSEYYDEDEDKRLHWIKECFYMALLIGIMASFASSLPPFYYNFFTLLYTVFYVYFSIQYGNYILYFHYVIRMINAPAEPADEEVEEVQESNALLDTQLEENIRRWIEEKKFVRANMTLSDVAEELGTNRTYFSRYLNTHLGTDFKKWRTNLRIEEARELLLTYHDKSAQNIAEMVGISDRSNFHNQFKGITGMSPEDYRKFHLINHKEYARDTRMD